MIRKIAAVAAITAAAALALGVQTALAAAAPAHAAAAAARPAGQDKAWVARQVRGLLRYNPGARQISANAVSYKGAILGVTAPGQPGSAAPDSASGRCPNDWLCLFWDVDFYTGLGVPWIKFYNCGVTYNLYNYKAGGGQNWADETSSIDYPGSADGHVAKFNHNGDWWLSLYRDHYLKNLTRNGGPNPQGNSNDWITGLRVC